METITSSLRQARMEFKTTQDAKALLGRAAALEGLDLTAFVLGPAIEKARRVITEHISIELNAEAEATLLRLLADSPTPTSAMRALMQLPDLPVREA